MNAEMIESLEVEGYGCIRNGTFKLSPLHALIGPNDAGKSTILRALRTAAQFAGGTFEFKSDDPVRPVSPFDPMIDDATRCSIRVGYSDGARYEVARTSTGLIERVQQGENVIIERIRPPWNDLGILRPTNVATTDPVAVAIASLRRRLSPARLLRLDPDAMRAPSALIPDVAGVGFRDERGSGLAGIYDVIINRDVMAFTSILHDVRTLFPNVTNIGLQNVSASEKALTITVSGAYRVPAAAVSEGLLYYLAFAAIRHLAPVSMVLVEEPENGLHPSRVADVMRVLRAISETTQVILATHSPLVINELTGGEVSLITRTAQEGTRARLLEDTFNYEERSRVYANGELWLSYANGEDEKGLLEAPERAS